MSYQLKPDGSFAIENYNNQKTFSSFLPGIAGLYGAPMWVFYVNRGQAVASFGVRDKDGALLEFFPANKAYQMTPSMGFRTFIRESGAPCVYEPFQADQIGARGVSTQTMEVSSHELTLRDVDSVAGWETTVTYFTVPEEPLAVLARRVTIKNLSKKTRNVEILDGLPQMIPFGMNEFFVKQMSRTIEAWMMTENLEAGAPFFRLRVDATDRPEVEVIRRGNFFFGLSEQNGRLKMLDPIVDPFKVFGQRLDFSVPEGFLNGFSADIISSQITENRTPCAFVHACLRMKPGEVATIQSAFGHAPDRPTLNHYLGRAKRAGYFKAKRVENRGLIEDIKSRMFTVSASNAFDLYCGQTYLDNVMRGGLPVCLGESKNPLIFYAYARKHGDLERDYNRFLVEPTYLAQGDGNYRDINQNRRCDPWFEPLVKSANIFTFMNLIQLDGFNPLVVKGTELIFHRTSSAEKKIASFLGAENAKKAMRCMAKSFKLGEFVRFLEVEKICEKKDFNEFLGVLKPFIETEQKANHGEGFWIDHWTYNLDLIENYLAIYPEDGVRLVFECKQFTFFDNDHFVRPRSFKYVLHGGKYVRQYKAVYQDEKKKTLIATRPHQANVVRTLHGRGVVYQTTLFTKLICLFANKIASLDVRGMGIEMEADKPSWYDALNGLPGLIGSSLSETFELKRLCLFVIDAIDLSGFELKSRVSLPEELWHFVIDLSGVLEKNFHQKSNRRDHDFWEATACLRENYREKIKWGVSGREKAMTLAEIRLFLERSREKLEAGIEKSLDKETGLYPTYFQNEPNRFKVSKGQDGSKTEVISFRSRNLPVFLEGPVHALKTEKDPQRRRLLAEAVKKSDLYDRKLGMYKVNASLESISLEAGRARAFKPGWLENESIWLHMEYKWLLELLRGGLHKEFFEDFFAALVPFQPAERYGRSILENSSFIVSSAFADPHLHGAGFVARLSGSTAEFLQMWLVMNIGKKPFFTDSRGKLNLVFDPSLPNTLFTAEKITREIATIPANGYAWMFLGKTLVIYRNPKRRDTFGKNSARPSKISLFSGMRKVAEVAGDTVPDPWARAVRNGNITRIEVQLEPIS